MLQDITEQLDESEKNAGEKPQQDTEKVKERRRQSLETFTQTKKRLGDTSELPSTSKKRNTGSETFREKAELDKAI